MHTKVPHIQEREMQEKCVIYAIKSSLQRGWMHIKMHIQEKFCTPVTNALLQLTTNSPWNSTLETRDLETRDSDTSASLVVPTFLLLKSLFI